MICESKPRGLLTNATKAKAEEYLGREFTQKELRLYPYLCSCAVDHSRIERSKTDDEEQEIIRMLEAEGRLLREYPSYMHPTKDFFEFMTKIVGEGYVEFAFDETV